MSDFFRHTKQASFMALDAWRLQISSFALLLSLMLLSIVLLVFNTVPFAVGLPGVLLFWVASVPAFMHLQKLDNAPVPLLPFVGLFYIFFFAAPIFLTPFGFLIGEKVVMYNYVIMDGILPEVVFIVLGGIGAMIGVYYFSQATLLKNWRAIRLPKTDYSPESLQLLYWLLLFASLAYRYSSTLQSLPSIGQFLDPVGYLGFGGIFLQWRAGHLPVWQKGLALLIALPLEIRWRLLENNLFVLIILIVFFVFILWRNGQFKVIKYLAITGVVVVASYNVTLPLRTHTGVGTLAGKAEVYKKYIIELSQGKSHATRTLNFSDVLVSYNPKISHLVHRMGQIWIFQHVYNQSPDTTAYWGGKSYLPLLTSFIPRMIYPNKPTEKIGFEFGYTYGITLNKLKVTSFNLPWITELLVNFGPIGVVIGMGLFGLFFAGLDRLFNARNMGEVDFLIGLTLIFKLWYHESNFSVMTGSLLPLFVCLYIYFRFGGKLLDKVFKGAH